MSATVEAVLNTAPKSAGNTPELREVGGHMVYDLPKDTNFYAKYQKADRLQPVSNCVNCRAKSRENFLLKHRCKKAQVTQ